MPPVPLTGHQHQGGFPPQPLCVGGPHWRQSPVKRKWSHLARRGLRESHSTSDGAMPVGDNVYPLKTPSNIGHRKTPWTPVQKGSSDLRPVRGRWQFLLMVLSSDNVWILSFMMSKENCLFCRSVEPSFPAGFVVVCLWRSNLLDCCQTEAEYETIYSSWKLMTFKHLYRI